MKATNDDSIGVKFANHFQLGSLNGLGFSWMASNNLLEGFSRISRYFKVISNAGKIVVNEDKKVIIVSLILPVPYGVAEDVGIDSALALFVQFCRIVRNDTFGPLLVNMQRPEPNSKAFFEDFFKCDIHYNTPKNELVFDKSDMLRPLPIANPDLARANDQVVIDYLRKHEEENTASKVSSLIIDALPGGTPALKNIAEQLFMSPKTLQRRLSSQGLTFSSLLGDIRLTLAKNYLAHEWRSIGEICYLLGFSEPSNFTRWFKGEVGMSPVEHRDKLEH